jgi:hypothetical protein
MKTQNHDRSTVTYNPKRSRWFCIAMVPLGQRSYQNYCALIQTLASHPRTRTRTGCSEAKWSDPGSVQRQVVSGD